MNDRDYVKVVAGMHTGAYGQILCQYALDLVHVEFIIPHNGFTGSSIQKKCLVLIGEKEVFTRKLYGC